ncbi:MAG: DUF4377 domain-containing protein [Bacteroidota bacterium]
MKHAIGFSIILITILASCHGKKGDQISEMVYFVNSLRVPCEAAGSTSCLQIKKEEHGDWQPFYASIGGFEYEPGFLYKIRVQEEKLPAAQVPADASSVRYTLLSILEKERDRKLLLNDIWALEHMKDVPFDSKTQKDLDQMPYIEIHLANKRILGHNGCNEFRGILTALDKTAINFDFLEQDFANCANKVLAQTFMQQLQTAEAYQLGRGRLTLTQGNRELLVFRKVD